MEKRVMEHKEGYIKGFSLKYKIRKLVYYENFIRIADAITREKQLKKWRRSKKIDLINSMNAEWEDLSLFF